MGYKRIEPSYYREAFGHHVTSAHEFNKKLIEDFDETDIFYIDHYL